MDFIWGLSRKEALLMTARFLACATRWIVVSFIDVGNAGRWSGLRKKTDLGHFEVS